ncbi:MAG TPA: DinB family protein [Candidatus Dormibacteraeota bacterium]|nr:DinB family protein [Candidatus Dormibacteraeota bacterium]
MTIDPVTEGHTYRELMFKLAGEGDPSDAMLKAPATVREIVAGAGDKLRTRPAEGEWSVLELLGHMVDAELMQGVRMRMILGEEDVQLAGYDQDEFVRAQRYNEAEPEPLLRALEVLRPVNVALWRSLSAEERQHSGKHSERGRESLETTYRMLAGHDVFHFDQMRKTLEAVAG